MKNYLIYPTKFMNISQGYNGKFSHYGNSHGTPKDYPIDEACKDSGRDYFYCPCDEIIVSSIYGVGGNGTNTIWLTSTSKVNMPCGEDYITIMVIHPEDDDLYKLKVGQKFKRKDPIFREGKDGFATGNHFHISFGKGLLLGNGWTQNDEGTWVLTTTNGTIKPENACYLDKTFTKVINSQNIIFSLLPYNKEDLNVIKGIDVSAHNGVINWDTVKSAGISFVMIRSGFGNRESQIDKRFKENIDGALKAGLNVGCYWFSYALNLEEVKQEAALFNKVISPYKGKLTFPVCYDFEYDSIDYAKKNGIIIKKSLATQFALTFCKEMENYGWYAMNYTNLDYYNNYFDSKQLGSVDTWYANWSINNPNINCGIWQYSSEGIVNGISGNVDMNISYRDYPNIIKNAKLNGFTESTDLAPTPEPDVDYKKKYEEELEYSETLIKKNEALQLKINKMKSEIQNILNIN